MSMPYSSCRTRAVSGCRRGLGRVPALVASTRPAVRRRSRASAMGERALLPVQTNSTATGAAGRGADGAGVRRSAGCRAVPVLDRKSTRLNSSHVRMSYAVFCLKKKKKKKKKNTKKKKKKKNK